MEYEVVSDSYRTEKRHTPAETLFAKALLKVEPEKFPEGSKARQDWLSLIIEVQVFLIENGYDEKLFRKELNAL